MTGSELQQSRSKTPHISQKYTAVEGKKRKRPDRVFLRSMADWAGCGIWLGSLDYARATFQCFFWRLRDGMTRWDGPNEHSKASYSEEGAHRTRDFE